MSVQVKYVDAGDLYVTWRWEHLRDQPRAVLVERAHVREASAALDAAVPSPNRNESGHDAVRRALTGPLLDLGAERRLAAALSGALLPAQLCAELNSLLSQQIRPHLRIQPSPSTARVPWEALAVSDAERLVHLADTSVLLPATVRNAPERRVSTGDGPVVRVVDPVVPGFADASALGSVLGPGAPRPVVDRDSLEELLVTASRFLYVGHVTTGGHALDARLHLSCGPDSEGRAGLVGGHRPLTAADLVLGHRAGPRRPWRIPRRVALVACESGGDLRFAEPSGLVAALVHGGAEHVVATRWTLPTDAGLAALVPVFPGTPVLRPAVRAIDAAQQADDPVAALNAWQRERADEWERTGDPACSPVVWAAFGTAWAPQSTVY
ncbi:CHAT domain-containing protein [Saccharothrix violaceirubra]|uniref:CHAT domain-containing protein n=1 Tax=Saccharothrix violaceirubra TaxID=413306 RepID=A0A7W7T616_9PSEU|nr:CHAT domain-containing protein [Saccharothrix violaceirubra]MBB4967237.1 hypothetical protein [Saccharothrix violaceirubra]